MFDCPIHSPDYLEAFEEADIEFERQEHIKGHPAKDGGPNCGYCIDEFLIEHRHGNDAEAYYAAEAAESEYYSRLLKEMCTCSNS